MSNPDKKPTRPRKVLTFVICLICTIILGLLLGSGIFLLIHDSEQASDAEPIFQLADQGYSGNSSQKLLSLIQDDDQIADTAERVQSSVVTIIVDMEYYGTVGQGLGSGVVFKEEKDLYYIITNAHVVSGASAIYLYSSTGELTALQLIGADTESDIAVLSLNKKQASEDVLSLLTVAEFGDSDAVHSGDLAIAIGSPQDIAYQNSVTVGIISHPKRELESSDTATVASYIQTDAAINPGNSGGALFNESGLVIGINSSKIASDDVEGIGFAISSNRAVEMANTLISEGFVQYLSLGGIEESTFLPESLASLYHVPSGLVIYSIRQGSSAETQGLRSGDIITEIDGHALTSMEDVNDILLSHEEGDTVEVTVIHGRNANNPITATLTLEPLTTDSDQKGGFWGNH